MTGDVTVASGVTLTIEAGVTVQGNSTFRMLTVNGSLPGDESIRMQQYYANPYPLTGGSSASPTPTLTVASTTTPVPATSTPTTE